MSIVEKVDAMATERAGNLPTWKPYYYESTDSGVIVKGCATTVFTRGPRKGQTKYLTKQDHKTILLSADDLKAIGD